MPSPIGDMGNGPEFPKPETSGINPPTVRNRRRARWKVLPGLDEIAPIATRALLLAGVALAGAYSNTGELADLQLKAEENAATTQEVRAAEATRTDDAYREYHELVTYHAVREAECDGALEVYERHMGDPHEWDHVLAECHSGTPAHAHEEDP